MVLSIGARSQSTIIPVGSFTKTTKQVDLTVTGSNWTTVRAAGVAYADSLGVWRLSFNITGSLSAGAADLTLTLASPTAVTFKNVTNFRQAVAVSCGTAPYTGTGFAIYNSDTITLLTHNDATSTTDWRVSGDVELESEPTWAAANMEGVANVSAYFPPADASTTGLLTNAAQTIAGVKTFNDGINLDEAAGQSTLNYYATGSIAMDGNFTSGTLYYTRVGNVVTLKVGVSGHGSASQPASGVLIPADMRPDSTVSNIQAMNGTWISSLIIEANGSLSVLYLDWAGSAAAQTSTNTVMTISYLV